MYIDFTLTFIFFFIILLTAYLSLHRPIYASAPHFDFIVLTPSCLFFSSELFVYFILKYQGRRRKEGEMVTWKKRQRGERGKAQASK